jgi:hypothetical protein
MFLSPLQHVPLPFTEQSVLYNDLKIRCNQQVWNKILNIKPCGGQISGTMELLICEYWSKSIIIGEQILTEKDRQRVTKVSPFGRNKAISLKPGRKNHPLRLVWWAWYIIGRSVAFWKEDFLADIHTFVLNLNWFIEFYKTPKLSS